MLSTSSYQVSYTPHFYSCRSKGVSKCNTIAFVPHPLSQRQSAASIWSNRLKDLNNCMNNLGRPMHVWLSVALKLFPPLHARATLCSVCPPTDRKAPEMWETLDEVPLFCSSTQKVLAWERRKWEIWTYSVHSLEAAPAWPGWRCYPKQSNGSCACLW